ncbi:MAG: histidine kinase [Actinoplanes sp.]
MIRRRRHGWLGVAEVSAFVLLAVPDAALQLRHGAPITHSAGIAAAVIVVLRRHFPHAVTALGAGALALAAIATIPLLSPTAVLATAIVVGVVARRLPPQAAVTGALAGGAVLVGAGMVAAGRDSPWTAAAGAVLWGLSVATGLLLRDADARRRAAASRARTDERLRIARELHDVVAHHVTGIVVRAQAARVITPAEADGYAEIEATAKDALTAMRRIVGTLREEGQPGEDGPAAATSDLGRSLKIAAADDPRVRLTVGELPAVPSRVVAVAYWLTLEALTNVRKHAPEAATVTVDARMENTVFDPSLVLVIGNDTGPARPRGEGFGLLGMAERVRGAGGTLHTGPVGDGRRWEVAARLPLAGESAEGGPV